MLSLAPEKGLANRYTCIVERSAFIDRGLVRRLLNRILHNHFGLDPASFGYDSPIGQRDRDGKIKRETCLPRLELDSRPSATLARDVDNGRLSSVTLVRAVPKVQVGGVPFLTKSEGTLRLSIDHGKITANVFGDIKKALKAEANDFPTAQIGFSLPNSKKVVSVKLNSEDGSPIDDLYTKTLEFVGITPPLANSSQKVVGHFERLIKPEFFKERTI